MTLAEQRLFCWKVGHTIAQTNLDKGTAEVADELFLWCQAMDDPKFAFRCLETAYQSRGGAITTGRLLTFAKDAYTFSGRTESRVAQKAVSFPDSPIKKGPTKKKTQGPRTRNRVQSHG